MPHEPREPHELDAPWKQGPLTPVEVEAEKLRERIAEEESKRIPSPELRELRKEYSKVKRYAEVVSQGRVLTLIENNFEKEARVRARKEDATRLATMHARRAWQDRMEQVIRERNREMFDWDFYRKHRWSINWEGRRLLFGEFVRVQTVGFKKIAWIKFAKVIQEFRMWNGRLR